MMAHLGWNGKLTPERLAELKEQFKAYKIDWDKIKIPPRPRTEISRLSDAELLKKIKILRHECGMSQRELRAHLHRQDVVFFTGPAGDDSDYIRVTQIAKLEKALEQSRGSEFFEDPEGELAPALRKIFTAQRRP